MNAQCLRFYIHENHKQDKKLAYEWLLEKAGGLGISNGNAFRAIAGFRMDGDDHHNDLMDSLMDKTIVIEFILTHIQADALQSLVREVGLPVCMTRMSIDFEMVAE